MTAISANFPEAIESRLEAGRVPRFGPLMAVITRPALALIAQALVVLLFTRLNVPDAPVTARNWWSVYGSLVDLGCLGLLVWLTRREGIHLRDLLSFSKNNLKRDILIGLGIFVVVFPVCVFGGGALAMGIAYGTTSPQLPEGTYIRTLPLLAALYSRLLWWPLWSFTEELTFTGYALPRLAALTKSRWLAVALVSFFWSIQHSFLPWVNPQHALYLFITFVPLTVSLQLIYLRLRRLPPLIIGHWLMDLFSAVFMIQIG